MTRRAQMRVIYGVLAVLNAALVALAIELAAGRVPLPPTWAWVTPVAVAAITAATALLPRVADLAGGD